MSSASIDGSLFQEPPTENVLLTASTYSRLARSNPVDASVGPERSARSRRTPKKSLIVVLPDDHVLASNIMSERLFSDGNGDDLDVIVACAGAPRNLGLLQRRVPDLRVLLAPAGTPCEDLRELAMTRAEGDIVTLLSGTLPECADR
jgi:hypothetical protein